MINDCAGFSRISALELETLSDCPDRSWRIGIPSSVVDPRLGPKLRPRGSHVLEPPSEHGCGALLHDEVDFPPHRRASYDLALRNELKCV